MVLDGRRREDRIVILKSLGRCSLKYLHAVSNELHGCISLSGYARRTKSTYGTGTARRARLSSSARPPDGRRETRQEGAGFRYVLAATLHERIAQACRGSGPRSASAAYCTPRSNARPPDGRRETRQEVAGFRSVLAATLHERIARACRGSGPRSASAAYCTRLKRSRSDAAVADHE